MQWDLKGCTDNYSHPRNIEHPGSIRNLHICGTIEWGCFSYLVGMKYRSSRFIQSQNVLVDEEFPHFLLFFNLHLLLGCCCHAGRGRGCYAFAAGNNIP